MHIFHEWQDRYNPTPYEVKSYPTGLHASGQKKCVHMYAQRPSDRIDLTTNFVQRITISGSNQNKRVLSQGVKR